MIELNLAAHCMLMMRKCCLESLSLRFVESKVTSAKLKTCSVFFFFFVTGNSIKPNQSDFKSKMKKKKEKNLYILQMKTRKIDLL